MNKSELVTAVAEKAGVPQATAGAVLEAFWGIVADVVGKGKEKLTIPGWISFEQTKRAARRARNLRTGEIIKVPATKAVRITAGSKLKAAAKGGAKPAAAAKAPAKKAAAKAPAKKAAAKKAPAKKAAAKAPAKKAAAKKAPAKKA